MYVKTMRIDIENKILVPVLLLVIIPVLAVGIFYYKGSHKLFLNKIEEELNTDLIEVENIIKENKEKDNKDIIDNIKDIKELPLIIYDKNKNFYINNDYNIDNKKLSKLMSSHISTAEKTFEIKANDNLLYFNKIKDLNWYIGTGQAISSLKSSLLEIQKYTILVAIIFVIIAVELTIALAYNLSKPIKKLTDFCDLVSKGDYDHHVKFNRKDEIGFLADSFNNMVQKINRSTMELKNLKEFNEDILRSTTTGIISVNPQGEIISINRAANNILNTKNLENKSILKKLKNLSIKSLNNREHYNKIMEFSNEENKNMIIEANTSLLTNEKKEVNGALCSFNDITERKKIEEKIEEIDRLSSLGELAAGLAHEIRNPLTGIKTSTEVLKNRIKDDNSRKLYKNVRSEIDRMDKLISDILNFARPHEPQFEVITIQDIIEESLLLMDEYFNNNNIIIKKEFPQNNLWVKVDSDQCKQIIINLYMNAINAMPDGGKMKISIKSVSENKVEISFEDNGKGIKEENIDKIFEPFYSTSSKGTGLGLAVVKRLVLENRGEIYVESEVNKGSNFKVLFPQFRGEKNEQKNIDNR